MTDTKLISQSNSGRLAEIAKQEFDHIISIKRDAAVANLIGKFQAGQVSQTDLIKDVATLAALRDISNSLTARAARGRKAMEKIYDDN